MTTGVCAIARRRRWRLTCRAGLLCVLLGICAASARAEDRAEVHFHGRSYSYAFSAVIDASLAAVHAVVTDFDRLDRVNDAITASRVVEHIDATHLKRLLALRECVLLICFDMRFVELVTLGPQRIETTIVTADSSFDSGHAEWLLEPIDAHHTRLSMSATQTPDFWIPPLVGPLLLKRVFLREVRETARNITRLAREIDARG